MPQDVSGVVVAVAAQRLSHGGILVGMLLTTADRPPVFAGSAISSRTAHIPVRAASTVHWTERGSSEGDEEPGVMPDAVRDALAAEEAGADEVEGVACVEVGARLTARFAAVAAAHRHPAARFLGGVVVPQYFTGESVTGCGVSGEIDGVCAAANGFDLFEPARESWFVDEPDKVAFGRRKKAQTLSLIEDRAPRLIRYRKHREGPFR
jgi:hypothetical protein